MLKRGLLIAHQGRSTAVLRCGKEGRLRVYQLAMWGEPDKRTPAERRQDFIEVMMEQPLGATAATETQTAAQLKRPNGINAATGATAATAFFDEVRQQATNNRFLLFLYESRMSH